MHGKGYFVLGPVENQYATKGLESEGIGEPQQQFLRSVFGDQVAGNFPRQLGHPLELPAGHFAAMLGEVGISGPLRRIVS